MWDDIVNVYNSLRENTISKKKDSVSTNVLQDDKDENAQQTENAFKKHNKKLHMFSDRGTLENFGFIGLTMPVTAIAPDIHTVSISTIIVWDNVLHYCCIGNKAWLIFY